MEEQLTRTFPTEAGSYFTVLTKVGRGRDERKKRKKERKKEKKREGRRERLMLAPSFYCGNSISKINICEENNC